MDAVTGHCHKTRSRGTFTGNFHRGGCTQGQRPAPVQSAAVTPTAKPQLGGRAGYPAHIERRVRVRELTGGSAEPATGTSSWHMYDVRSLPDLARVLRELRRRHARDRGGAELTYRELAAATGWSHGIIGEYLAGRILPPTDRFDVLVRMLGAAPAEQG